GDADRRAAVADAVAGPPAAVAASGEEVHDVVAMLLRIVAAEAEIAAGTRGRREEPVGYRFRQRQEHRFNDALRHLGGAPGDGSGILGIKERALSLLHRDRRKAA